MSWMTVSSQAPARTSRTCSFTCSMPPSSMRAIRRASSGLIPWRIFSSASRSTYVQTSSSSSRSSRRLPKVFRKKLVMRDSMGMLCPPSARGFFSFVPQRDHGIDANGAARGNVAGNDCDEDEQNCRRGKRCGIAGADREEKAGHQPGKRERSDHSDDNPGECDSSSLVEDYAKNVGALRSERHAHADFVSALRDGIRNHAVASDGRENQGECAEK